MVGKKTGLKYYIERARTRRDFNDIRLLDIELFETDPRIDPEDGIYWVMRAADGKNTAVGFSGMQLLPKEPGTALRTRSGVKRGHRGQGLQVRLLKVSIEYCKKHGIQALLATTALWNYWSSNNFIKAGFSIYDPTWRWMHPMTIYWKWLNK